MLRGQIARTAARKVVVLLSLLIRIFGMVRMSALVFSVGRARSVRAYVVVHWRVRHNPLVMPLVMPLMCLWEEVLG